MKSIQGDTQVKTAEDKADSNEETSTDKKEKAKNALLSAIKKTEDKDGSESSTSKEVKQDVKKDKEDKETKSDTEEEKNASASKETPQDTLVKMAGDMNALESDMLVKEANFYGAAVCDGFMARMSEYEKSAETIQTEEKTASTETLDVDVEKVASDAFAAGYEDTMEKVASDAFAAGYTETMDKLAEEAFAFGYTDALEKVASDVHATGYNDTVKLLTELADA